MTTAVEVKGAKRFLDRVAKLQAGMPKAMGQAVYLWGVGKLGPATLKLCPVDTGRLRASWHVELPVITPDGVEVKFGYGTNYALYVHNRAYHVRKAGTSIGPQARAIHHETGRDHFLSIPFDDLKATAAEWIANKARELLAKQGGGGE